MARKSCCVVRLSAAALLRVQWVGLIAPVECHMQGLQSSMLQFIIMVHQDTETSIQQQQGIRGVCLSCQCWDSYRWLTLMLLFSVSCKSIDVIFIFLPAAIFSLPVCRSDICTHGRHGELFPENVTDISFLDLIATVFYTPCPSFSSLNITQYDIMASWQACFYGWASLWFSVLVTVSQRFMLGYYTKDEASTVEPTDMGNVIEK